LTVFQKRLQDISCDLRNNKDGSKATYSTSSATGMYTIFTKIFTGYLQYVQFLLFF